MKRWAVAVLLGLCFCHVQAAEAPAAAEEAPGFRVFKGQWNFLIAGLTYCAEKVPGMKREIERTRDHAEQQLARAELTVLDEAEGNMEGYKPFISNYANGWIRYADELVAAIRKQDPVKACPDLRENWNITDVDTVLEDWRNYVERNGPIPKVAPKQDTLHGTK